MVRVFSCSVAFLFLTVSVLSSGGDTLDGGSADLPAGADASQTAAEKTSPGAERESDSTEDKRTEVAPSEARDSGESDATAHAASSASPSSTDEDESESSENARNSSFQWKLSINPSSNMRALRNRVRRCLAFYYKRPLNTRDASPWSMMHAMLSFGVDSTIRVSHPQGRTVNAASWLCANRHAKGMRLMSIRDGQIYPHQGPGYQGHPGQFLAMLAQLRVKSDYPLQVDGSEFTVQDLIEYEQSSCREGTELTFKLLGLIHYLPSDSQWTDSRGESWDFPRLIHEERRQPINGATCGGSHRLMALSFAVHARQKRGEPLEGEWAQAEAFTKRYQRMALNWQNRDGSFSTSYFRGPGNDESLDRQLVTTGHILEWLVYSLPGDDVLDRRVLRAVNFLTNLMSTNRYYEWEAGPRSHAIRALTLFDERVFGGTPGTRSETLVNLRTPPQEDPSERRRPNVRFWFRST